MFYCRKLWDLASEKKTAAYRILQSVILLLSRENYMHGPQPMQRNHSYLTYTYLLVQGRHLINTFVRYLSKGPVGMDA